MSQYNKLLKSLAMNANNRKIETEASGGTNYYTTGATLGGDNILTGSTQATTWTANLSSLAGSSPLTTKGDIYVFGSSNTRLPVGANGKVLKADSSTTTGLVWGDDTGTIGGSIAEDRIAVGAATANTIAGYSTFEWDAATLKMTNAGDTAITLLGDSNRTSADAHVAALRGKWNGTAIGTFMVMSGPDTTNKDDGQLTFQTASAGTLAERMRIDETGNVGIGTPTPTDKLNINTGAGTFDFRDYNMTYSTSLGIRAEGTGYLGLVTEGANEVFLSTNGFANKRLRVTSGGDVTLGGEAATVNGARLHVNASDENLVANFFSTDGIGEIRVGDNYSTVSHKYTRILSVGHQLKLMPNNGAEMMNLDGSAYRTTLLGEAGGNSPKLTFDNPDASTDIQLTQGDAGWFGLSTDGGSTQHFIARTGNIGIGTESPSTKLDVVGTITAGANSYTTISDNEYDVSSGDLLFDVAGDITLDADGADIRLSDGGTQYGKFRPDSNDFAIHSSVNDAKMLFKGEDGGSTITAMTIDMANAGSVGIGTTSPQRKLHVMTASAGSPGYGTYANMILESDDHSYFQFSSPSNKVQGINFGDGNDNAGAIYYDHASDYMRFFAGAAERVRIDSAGNVGIGTNAPSAKLNVSGGSTTLDNAGGYALYFKNDGVQYGAVDTYGTSLSIEANNEAILSGASGVLLRGGNYGVLLEPLGTSAGDTSRLRFRELAANGTATVSIKAPDSIASDTQLILPASAGTANQVLAIDSVSSGIMTLGFQDAGGGTIGGSITDNQVAVGASTANSIEGSANLTYDGTNLTLARTADDTSRGISILDNEGTETIRLATHGDDQGLLYLRGPTGGNAIYLDGNGASYMHGGYIGFGTSSPDNTAEMTIVGAVYQDAGTSGIGNINYGSGSLAHTSGRGNYGGSYSTALGFQSLALISGNAHRNTAVGYRAMYGDSTGIEGTDNTSIGASSMLNIKDGQYNVAVGVNALQSVTDGGSNVAIGVNAGKDLTTASTNTLMGLNTGENITTGGSNNAFGYDALKTNTTGTSNTAIGNGALRSNDYSWNTAVGTNAARVYTGHSIVALGYEAGSQNVSGGGNTLIGNVAFYNHAAGASNTVIGSGSMQGDGTNKPSSSSNNTSIGVSAMKFASGSQSSVAIGNGALAGTANNTSNNTVAIGYKAASGTTGGDNNVAIGYESLVSVGTGYENTAVGYLSMKDNTTGLLNVAIGAYAATGMTTGQDNVAVGHSALQENQEGDDMVAIGRYAAYNTNPTAGTGDSVVIGSSAAFTNTTGVQNVVIGRKAAYSGTTANNLVVIGREAGEKITTGSSNVVIGGRAGYNITKGAENVMIGQNAGYNYAGITSGVYGAFSTFIGHAAGYAVTGGHSYGSVMAIGHQPMYNATGAKKTIAIGQSAVVSGTNVEETVALGNGAGAYANATGSVYVGNKAGFRPSGNYNVAVGYQALSGASAGSTAQQNVAIGYQSGLNVTSGLSNILIGRQAGYGITTAQKSVVIGSNAGYAMAGQGASVLIGFESGRNQNAGSGGSVAIGHQALYSGTQNYQDTAIGINAGKKATGASANNVFLGSAAGPSTTGVVQNKLYIHNAEGTPLIYGDFSAGTVTINGVLSATAKSFNIAHPLYKDKRLVHGSLEGPEHGIYIRGTIEATEGCVIELPEYWSAMCEDYTVQLTPHGPYTVFIQEKHKDKVMIASSNKDYKFDYFIVGKRTDEEFKVVQDA